MSYKHTTFIGVDPTPRGRPMVYAALDSDLHLISLDGGDKQDVVNLVAKQVHAVVSVCGPIGFVGLIVPHIAALLAGSDKRLLLPVAAMAGASFLILCDWLTGLIPRWYGSFAGRELTAARLPIGVMTALIGAPLFLVLLRKRLR